MDEEPYTEEQLEEDMEAQAQDEEIIDNLGEEDFVIPYQYAITSWGVDFDVEGLVRRMRTDEILIPRFQRQFIWDQRKALRFIESLLLGLPVPGIFLETEPSQKYVIIDGQQRLKTLQFFFDGVFGGTGREFALKKVQVAFEERTYKTLCDEDRRKLNNSVIHATVVRQDEPSDDHSSIYHIFERLNTGGMILRAQEIRACIYHGPFNELLDELNDVQAWRNLYGRKDKRMRDQELILRFFALNFHLDGYKRPMKVFLNRYMGANRGLSKETRPELTRVFTDSITTACDALGAKAFKPESILNAAVFDSVMIGLARRLGRGPITDLVALQRAYDALLDDAEYVAATKTNTSDNVSVKRRIDKASQAFVDVP